ncbi:MAG: hypothetical protein GY773_23125, partial [Actinomycetia bacterium]|nr:hypothetical protein [Actinomycetes bacterium]
MLPLLLEHCGRCVVYETVGTQQPSKRTVFQIASQASTTNTDDASPVDQATRQLFIATTAVSADASDNVGVTRVEFYDGTTLKGTDTTSPYSYAWTFSSIDNGSHSWTAKAYDAAGNERTSSALSLTVDIPLDPLGLIAAYGFEEA